jgi:hypothetical protein
MNLARFDPNVGLIAEWTSPYSASGSRSATERLERGGLGAFLLSYRLRKSGGEWRHKQASTSGATCHKGSMPGRHSPGFGPVTWAPPDGMARKQTVSMSSKAPWL